MKRSNGLRKVLPIAVLACACALSACLVACGGSGGSAGGAAGAYKDGTYSGESSVLEAGVDGDGYGMVSITVKDGKISDCTFQAYLPDGTLKDDSYGKGTAKYSLAQKIVDEVDDYAAALVEAGDPADVDVISGATFLHDQFVEAANDALEQAKA